NVVISALPAVDMVGAGQAAGGKEHDEEKRGHGKADDNGGEYQGLRHGGGKLAGVDTIAPDNGSAADGQAAHGEDEEVDRVGEQRKPDDHLEGAGAQHQVDAAAAQDTDADGEDEFHQRISTGASGETSGTLTGAGWRAALG